MSTEEFLCARCARQGKTCCQQTEIHVTLGDRERIARALARDDFWERRLCDNPEYRPDDDDPVWALIFDAAGRRAVLRRTAAGDCVFLTPRGCALPEEARPLVCRLYPFAYDHRGVSEVEGDMCPEDVRADGERLVALLGMARERAERWRDALYAEIRAGDGSASDP